MYVFIVCFSVSLLFVVSKPCLFPSLFFFICFFICFSLYLLIIIIIITIISRIIEQDPFILQHWAFKRSAAE